MLLFDAALTGDVTFEHYQETQGDPSVIKQFRKAKHIAEFVVEPCTKNTLFAGVGDMLGERPPKQRCAES